MQEEPTNWARALSAPQRKIEYRYIINGVEYTNEHLKSVPTINKALFDTVTIGKCATGSMTIQVFERVGIVIPKAAEVKAYCRVNSVDRISQPGTAIYIASGWAQIGHYFVSRRSEKDGVITLLCRDDLIKAGAPYIEHTSFDEWPQKMSDVVADIASIMGVALDSRTRQLVSHVWDVDYPGDLLMTEVLGMIGAAHGGNWIITETGKLRLVSLISPSDTSTVGTAYQSLTLLSRYETVSRITLTDNDGNVYTAGNDSGIKLIANCDYATQDIVDEIGEYSGYISVKPFNLSGAYINPLTELGDMIQVSQNGSTVSLFAASMTIRCTVGFTADIAYGATTDNEDEYPYLTQTERTLQRTVKTGSKYYGNSITRTEGFKSELASGAFARFNADGMDFVDENGKRCLYYDMDEKTFVFDGSFQSQSVVTETIYAEYGDVAELTVDRLATDKKVSNYLLGDTSDVNYVKIQERTFSFITGTYSGGTVRHTDRSGRPLWWVKDIEAAYIDADGVPWTDSTQAIRITMSTDLGDANTDGYVRLINQPDDWETNWTAYYRYSYADSTYVRVTDATAPVWVINGFFQRTRWPVMIYTYAELTKMQFFFEEDSETGNYVPVIEIGAGNPTGYNKCRIYKDQDAMRIMYTNASGNVNEISHASSENFWRINGYGFLPVASLPPTQLQDVVYFTPVASAQGG